MMNAQEIAGKWNQIRGDVKQKWGKLTEDELAIHDGNMDQLVGRIQRKTGETREAIENYLTELTSRASSTVSRAAASVGGYVENAAAAVRDGYEDVADTARASYGQARGLVCHRPGQSIAVAFAAGAAVGLCIGFILAPRRSPSWWSSLTHSKT